MHYNNTNFSGCVITPSTSHGAYVLVKNSIHFIVRMTISHPPLQCELCEDQAERIDECTLTK